MRAKAHVELVEEAYNAMVQHEKKFDENSYKYFGTFPGLVLLHAHLKKYAKVDAAKKVHDYLSEMPGVRNTHDFFDLKKNQILVACEQLDHLIPIGMEMIIANGNPGNKF